jgi:hypothetical protein
VFYPLGTSCESEIDNGSERVFRRSLLRRRPGQVPALLDGRFCGELESGNRRLRERLLAEPVV